MSDQNVPPVTGNRVLRFKVSYAVLRHVMHIPEDSKLLTIVPDEFDTCHFIVSNEKFPVVQTGAFIPETTPTLTENRDDDGKVEEIIWDWNLPEEEEDHYRDIADAISFTDRSKVSRDELEEYKKLDWAPLNKEFGKLIRTVDYLINKLDTILHLVNDASGRTQDVASVLDDVESEVCRND